MKGKKGENESIKNNSKPEAIPNSSYRYSDNELEEFRNIINDKIQSATKEFLYLQEQLQRNNDLGSDISKSATEDGTATLEMEQISQLAARQRQLITNLENALIRIENKTYGICRVTGKLIDKARLKVVPHATLSMEAKNKK